MKYINFKRYKFDVIIKYFNFLHYKNYNIKFFVKYLNPKRYNFQKIYKSRILRDYKKLPLYFLAASVFIMFIYVSIPLFYTYDKLELEKIICKNINIKCEIKGAVNYSILPTPRIKIENFIIKDPLISKKYLLRTDALEAKIPLKNLLNKNKQNFNILKLKNFVINLDTKNYKNYKNIFKEEFNYIPIILKKGKIVFNNDQDYIATISEASLILKFIKDSFKIKINGEFLEDKLSMNIESAKIEEIYSTDLTLKMSNLNLLSKINIKGSKSDDDIKTGKILIKQRKNKVTSIFTYKDNEINIEKSNVSNNFFEGKMYGKIVIRPFLDFNLNLDLNSIYFTKLYKYFLSLNEITQKNIFRINNKINGKLNLSSEKIYSSYNLVKSFESRIKFNNGNIIINQFLVNLGKLGAADILGKFDNSKKFTQFKFESNVFVDNQKKFLSKFGIYKKKSISPNIFISGGLDLTNESLTIYEISGNEKLKEEEINFIEQEFNGYMLNDGFKNLFVFPKFKEFIKSATDEPS